MNLSVIWRLQDLMTPVMNRVGKSARTAQEVVERVNSRMAAGFRTSAQSVTGLREKIDTLQKYRDGLRIGIDGREIRQANAELQLLQTRLDRVDRTNNRKTGRGGGMLGGMGGLKGLAAGYGLYEAGRAGLGAISDGMDMNQSKIMLEAFVGNSQKANEIMSKLNAYSEKYAVYDRKMLFETASRIASTFGPDSVVGMTQMVGKLALGNKERFKGILGRLEQIKGTGYLQGDELNELMNQGVFGLSEQIQKMKGITAAQFNKLKEAQQIPYQDVIAAMVAMTTAGGKFNDKLDVMMFTARGKWDTILGMIRNRITNLGESTSNGLSKAMGYVIQFFQRSAPIGEALARLGKAFKPLLNGIYRLGVSFGIIKEKGDGVGTAVAIISNIMNRLAYVMSLAGRAVQWVAGMFEEYPWLKYALGFVAISYGIGAIDNKVKILKAAFDAGKLLSILPFGNIATGFAIIGRAMASLWLNPIGLIVLGVLALGAAIYYAWNNSEDFRRVTIQTWEGLKFLWNSAATLVMEAWAKISPVFTYIAIGWRILTTIIKSSAYFAWAYVTSIFESLTRPIVWAFEKAKTYISDFWEWYKDKALRAVRVVAAIATLGLSEIGIGLFKKFKIGYDKGANVAANFEKDRSAADKGKQGKKGSFLADFFGGNIPGLGDKLEKMGSGSGVPVGKGSGITDAVNGSVSKQVTININSKIADINNYFNNESDQVSGKTITDIILTELNRVLITGDRLALE